MQGSLDNPPVVVTQDRLKQALHFVLFAVLAGVLAIGAMLSFYLKDQIWALLGLTFLVPVGLGSAVAALASGWNFLRPATLTLDAEGLIYRAYWYERRHRWSDIAEFCVFAPSDRVRTPGCVFEGGRRTSFGRGWETDAAQIVALLNAAKETWAGDRRL